MRMPAANPSAGMSDSNVPRLRMRRLLPFRRVAYSAASAALSWWARYRSASSAAMQPMPAAVTAWR